MTGKHDCLLQAAKTSLGEHMYQVQRSVLDKVKSAELRIATQRSDLHELRRSLTDTDLHLSRLHLSFQSLSDDLAQLDSQLEVDRYLATMIDKLIQYGRAIRLVVCCVDPSATGNSQPCCMAASIPHYKELSVLLVYFAAFIGKS